MAWIRSKLEKPSSDSHEVKPLRRTAQNEEGKYMHTNYRIAQMVEHQDCPTQDNSRFGSCQIHENRELSASRMAFCTEEKWKDWLASTLVWAGHVTCLL